VPRDKLGAGASHALRSYRQADAEWIPLAPRRRRFAVPILEPAKITNRALFHATGDPARDVVIGKGEGNWHHFAYGYKAAARELVSHLSGRGRVIEAACLPILFLYRHSVELTLKELVIDLGELTDSPETTSREHRLTPLWHQLRAKTLAYDRSQDSNMAGPR
jgi:hypothetical protein